MKHTLELDDEEYAYEGWAFLHFHTSMPGYALADSLNRLYDYHLTRQEDMALDDTGWPLFRYEDSLGKMLFFLVEVPASATTAPWDAGDKIFLLKGENAEWTAQHIFADFTSSSPVDEADLLAREHAELLDDLLAGFTVVNILDFSTAPTSRKATKDRQMVQQHCDIMLAFIEQKHLDLSREELMRLRISK